MSDHFENTDAKIHREYMYGIKDYIPIQEVILSILKDKSTIPYELLYHSIISDPQIVTICGKCRLCFSDQDTSEKILAASLKNVRLFHADSDSVSLGHLYYGNESEFANLGLKNQFELRAILSYSGVRVGFDLVSVDSLEEVARIFVPEEKPRPSTESENNETNDSDLTQKLMNMLQTFRGMSLLKKYVASQLEISDTRLEEIIARLPEDSSIIINDTSLYYPLNPDKHTASEQNDVSKKNVIPDEEPAPRNTVSKKPDKDYKIYGIPDDQKAAGIVADFMRPCSDIRVAYSYASRCLGIPESRFDELSPILFDKYGITATNGILYYHESEEIGNSENNVSNQSDSVSNLHKKQETEKSEDDVKQKGSDVDEFDPDSNLKEMRSLFEDSREVQNASTLIARYYSVHNGQATEAKSILDSIVDSPFVIRVSPYEFRLVIYRYNELLELFSKPEFQDLSKIDETMREHLPELSELGISDTDLAVQIWNKIESAAKDNTSDSSLDSGISDDTSSGLKVHTDDATPSLLYPQDYKKWEPRILAIIQYGREVNLSKLLSDLKSRYDDKIDEKGLIIILDWLVDNLKLFKNQYGQYIALSSSNPVEDVAGTLKNIQNCVYSVSKLYSLYFTKWNKMGITNSFLLKEVVSHMYRVKVKGELVIFDDIDPLAFMNNVGLENARKYYGISPAMMGS